jgi:DNA recombination protein RmuC
MTVLIVFLLLCLFGAVGASTYFLADLKRWRRTAENLEKENQELRSEAETARESVIRQEGELSKVREVADVQLKALNSAHAQLEDRFRTLASDVLQNNSQMLLDRSREQFQHLVEPVNQSLHRFEVQVQNLEQARAEAYGSITAQVKALTSLQERVRESTEQLKTALRSPIQRGRWGEIQLRRVVELAGMLEQCDFA